MTRPTQTDQSVMDPDTGYVGRSVPRAEDARLLVGRGRFVADLATPGTLHAAFVRSTQAHAMLGEVDAAEARTHPGVVAIVTGEDLLGKVGPLPLLGNPAPPFVAASHFSMSDSALPCLPHEQVHYVGQPLALVVAESRRVAEDAVERVSVSYEPLPVVADLHAAMAADAPALYPWLPDNEAARISCSFGDVDAARREAATVVRDTYRIGRSGGVPLECRGVLARIDARRSRIEVWTSTQMPHLVRQAICLATGWPIDEVRVAAPEVGGGFGTKANVYAEEVVVPFAARMLQRDVIWLEDRFEHLTGAAQSRDQVHDTQLSVDGEGRILAWEDDFSVDVGAGSLWTSGIVANTAIHLMGPYRIPAYRADGRAFFTNRAIVAQYRGAGRPEACFALERSLDHAADTLGMSRVEIRRRNLLTHDDLPYSRPLPYRDGVPIRYDGGDYRECLDACVRMLPEDTVAQLQAEYPNERLGHGVAAYIEATGRGPWEYGSVTLGSSGRFHVTAGSASAGQGHETTLAQIAADALAVTPDDIVVVVGDTDAIAEGVGTFGSRSVVMAGNAVHLASTRLVDRARELAGSCLAVKTDEVVLDATGFHGPDSRTLSWSELAGELRPEGKLAMATPLEEVASYEPETVTWTMGAHAAVVAVDEETGLCKVLRYAVAHEGGVEINPLIVDGQVLGGVAQGLGGALLEEFRYDADGQPLSVSFADYLLPESCDVPHVDICHRSVITPANPLGVRGIGESGTIAVYAAVASAVEAALGGERVRAVPVEPSWVAMVARGRRRESIP